MQRPYWIQLRLLTALLWLEIRGVDIKNIMIGSLNNDEGETKHDGCKKWIYILLSFIFIFHELPRTVQYAELSKT